MPLILTLGPFSVECSEFIGEEYPRVEVQGAEVEYSNHGNAIGYGPAYVDKHLWSFKVGLDEAQFNALKLLYAEFKYRRAKPSAGSANVLLLDTTQTYEERAPRTRAVVPATTEELINGGTHVRYYAQFYTWFTSPLRVVELGTKWGVGITLAEMGKVAP